MRLTYEREIWNRDLSYDIRLFRKRSSYMQQHLVTIIVNTYLLQLCPLSKWQV